MTIKSSAPFLAGSLLASRAECLRAVQRICRQSHGARG
jgi:hypothetical protein